MVSLQWFWHSLHTSRSVVIDISLRASPVRIDETVWRTPSTTISPACAAAFGSSPAADSSAAAASTERPSAPTCALSSSAMSS